jgi:hypothetical protein
MVNTGFLVISGSQYKSEGKLFLLLYVPAILRNQNSQPAGRMELILGHGWSVSASWQHDNTGANPLLEYVSFIFKTLFVRTCFSKPR